MTTRILPRAEYDRLEATEAGPIHADLPHGTQVLVVEDTDGAIVGCWILLSVVHAECLWIAPQHRGKGSVARRLWAFMRQTAQDRGASRVWTASMSDEVTALLGHIGATKVPGTHFVMGV